jgi:hypothetical protein
MRKAQILHPTTADIHENSGTPFLDTRMHRDQRLKSGSATRQIPVRDLLIRRNAGRLRRRKGESYLSAGAM